MNKPHIYFNRIWKSWAVRRNRAGTEAWIRAMGWAHVRNQREGRG